MPAAIFTLFLLTPLGGYNSAEEQLQMPLARPIVRTVPVEDEFQSHPGRRMTEQEFVQWVGEKTRAEWINGDVIVMPPANIDHDDVVAWFRMLLTLFVQHFTLGRVLGPEVSVRFARQRRRRQPDVLFVAKDRIDIVRERHVEGPPDLIVEVVSPDSTIRDWREKYLDYERAGVREYWVVDRLTRRVEAYALTRRGSYQRIASEQGRIPSGVIPGLSIDPESVLGLSLPPIPKVLRQLGVKL